MEFENTKSLCRPTAKQANAEIKPVLKLPFNSGPDCNLCGIIPYKRDIFKNSAVNIAAYIIRKINIENSGERFVVPPLN